MAVLFDPHFQAAAANGRPESGAQLFFYRAGTSSLIPIYKNSDGATPHTNPVIANAAGKFPAIFIASANPFKIILKSSNGVVIDTIDQIPVGEVIDLETLGQIVDQANDAADRAETWTPEYAADVLDQVSALKDETSLVHDETAALVSTAINEADRAGVEADRAELARDASFVGDRFETIAAGLAAVADGASFVVVGSGDVAAYSYKRVGSEAVLLGPPYPSVAGVGAQIDARGTHRGGDTAFGYLHEWLDADRRRLAGIRTDGTFEGKFAGLSDVSAETIQARGSRDDLNDRLNETMRADGLAKTPLYGGHRLRETRRILQQLKSGAASTQLVINAFGDSWTDSPHYLRAVTRQLMAAHGNAGAGFIGFGTIGADDALGAASYTDGWERVRSRNIESNPNIGSPQLSKIVTSTPGETVTLIGMTANVMNLKYFGGTGTVRYRYNSGSWVALALDGSGAQSRGLAVPPSEAFSAEIEVVSGTCELFGVEAQLSANGVRVNKLGLNGSRAYDHVIQDRTAWVSGVTSLGGNLATIMFGVNDRSYFTAAEYAGHLIEIIDRIKEATPLSDILIVSPPEVIGSFTYPLADYAYVARSVATAEGVAHLDLQPLFGDVVADYGDAGLQYILAADPVHPALKGGAVLAEAFLRTILVS